MVEAMKRFKWIHRGHDCLPKVWIVKQFSSFSSIAVQIDWFYWWYIGYPIEGETFISQ